MEYEKWKAENVTALADTLHTISTKKYMNARVLGCAKKYSVIELIHKIQEMFFPGIFEMGLCSQTEQVVSHEEKMNEIIALANCIVLSVVNCEAGMQLLKDAKEHHKKVADTLTMQFIESLAKVRALLDFDIQAAYEGDPAARSTDEIILCYPSITAVCIYRLAHVLYRLNVPVIPRVMTEYAHQLTGIDIHPGATIGTHFFIDHGTGVVIGETCTIGNNVKLYQGVTLGARSFKTDDAGNLIKGIKRHPDIGDNVVIYAGATVLGGDTVIGQNSVIGGNVWLTHSVAPNTKVYNEEPSLIIKQHS